ncbi:MAG: cyclase family protein [Thermomicrobiales bacterium]|nr:cyclase family protein [Thermomicrobiales bacterium]
MPLFAPGARVIDITVPFSPLVPTWPSHPVSAVEPMTRVAQGDRSNVSRISISSHAGTHVDANWHFIDDGKKLLEIPIDRWLGPCWVAHIPDERPCVEPADLEAANIPPGTERLLLRTRNSRDWAAWDRESPLPFREDYVGVTPEGARWLVDRGVRLIGIDYLSVGPYGPANRESHLTLLGNDVLIAETLDLSQVAAGPYDLVCLPLKLAVGDGAPARAYLVQGA